MGREREIERDRDTTVFHIQWRTFVFVCVVITIYFRQTVPSIEERNVQLRLHLQYSKVQCPQIKSRGSQ